MPFNVRADSSDIQHSVHVFSGDDAFSPDAYRQAVYSGYLSSVSTAYGAARGCGLDVDSETFERWKRCGAAAGLLDDFMDESPRLHEASELYLNGLGKVLDNKDDVPIPEWADDRLATAVALLRSSVDVLPEKQKEKLAASARAIGIMAVRKAECSDVREYIACLIQEGRDTAALVSESASEYVHAQPSFPTFREWCGDALEFATLADSARDLWADKNAGLVSVDATALNSLRIAASARHSARKLYKRQPARRATLTALASRMVFSKRPTKSTMRRNSLKLLE